MNTVAMKANARSGVKGPSTVETSFATISELTKNCTEGIRIKIMYITILKIIIILT